MNRRGTINGNLPQNTGISASNASKMTLPLHRRFSTDSIDHANLTSLPTVSKVALPVGPSVGSSSPLLLGNGKVSSGSISDFRHYAACYINEQVVLIGRDKENLTVSTSDIPGTFNQITMKNSPTERSGSALIRLNEKHIVLGGGVNDSLNENELYIIDLNLQEWRKIPVFSAANGTRSRHAGTTISWNNYYIIYTFGGISLSKMTNQIDIIIIPKADIDKNPSCSIASYVCEQSPSARADHTIIKCNEKIYLFGGINPRGKCLNDLWELDYSVNPLKPKWSLLSLSGPAPRHRHISYVKNGELWIAGGYTASGEPVGDIWRWDGTAWFAVSVFESSLPLVGTPQGVFYYASRLAAVTEMPARKSLDTKFAELRKHQALFSAVERAENATERRVIETTTEIYDRLNALKSSTPDENTVSCSMALINNDAINSIFDGIKSKREELVEELKVCLCETADSLKKPPKPSLLATYHKSLENKAAQLEAADKKLLAEIEATNSAMRKQLDELNAKSAKLTINIDAGDFSTFEVASSSLSAPQKAAALQAYVLMQTRELESLIAQVPNTEESDQKIERSTKLLKAQTAVREATDQLQRGEALGRKYESLLKMYTADIARAKLISSSFVGDKPVAEEQLKDEYNQCVDSVHEQAQRILDLDLVGTIKGLDKDKLLELEEALND